MRHMQHLGNGIYRVETKAADVPQALLEFVTKYDGLQIMASVFAPLVCVAESGRIRVEDGCLTLVTRPVNIFADFPD